ncbi:hypothetical protein Tco_0166270, partial [Tanacetum coccineum]
SLTAYADADHARCQDSRRSTSGSAQFLRDRLVSWSSKKQRSTEISTTEAEYIAMTGCCAQITNSLCRCGSCGMSRFKKKYVGKCSVCWLAGHQKSKEALQYLQQRLNTFPCLDVVLKSFGCDYSSKTTDLTSIKFLLENRVVELYFVEMNYQLADILTKALPRERFEFLLPRLDMKSLTPETLRRLQEGEDE